MHADSLEATPQSGLSPELKEALEKLITENKVVLFMKGTRQFPQVRACNASGAMVQRVSVWSHREVHRAEHTFDVHVALQCGFSNTCVQILNTLSTPYETVNILEDERLRSGMKEFSQVGTS